MVDRSVNKSSYYLNIMLNFGRRVLNSKKPKKTSPITFACKALAELGYVRPDNISEEQWIFDNWKIIDNQTSSKNPTGVKRVKKNLISNQENNKVKKEIKKYVTDAEFLASYEWRRLRYETLLKHGRKCQCCGASPETGAVLNVDHIKPRRTHPELAVDPDNLQVLCGECNHGKGNWDTTDFRSKD